MNSKVRGSSRSKHASVAAKAAATQAQNHVDRLSFIDGVVVAVGWTSESSCPRLTRGGVHLENQTSVRYQRPDLTSQFGDSPVGFRLSACLQENKIDGTAIKVLFENGDALGRTNKNDRETGNTLFQRFVDIVNSDAEASLIEIGSRARSGNTYRGLFPNLSRYTGTDITDGPNVDVIADAHRLSSSITQKSKYAFSVSVFEHLLMPLFAAIELNKVMEPGGLALIQSHAAWPLHEEPWDFFRFSKEAWAGVFNQYSGFEVVEAGYTGQASIVAHDIVTGAAHSLDQHPTFLLSLCLARKVADPVGWTVNPQEITDLRYTHGTV